ncbi:MAG: hypothetical protein HQK81_11810 [Desulfovibrionaceae bacterium]|nr:hypothetical protein [Desulfovibrionaceae bacterium]MBF0514727.1 hypothetical protein [Desulfovibrionaceae bacterium]
MPVTQTQAYSPDALQATVSRTSPPDNGPARDATAFQTMLQTSLGINGDIMTTTAKKGADKSNKDPVKAYDAAAGQVLNMGGQMRGQYDPSQIRMRVSKTARHPDDLGHLRDYANGSLSTKGFSPKEEDLLLRAAASESKLMYAGRMFPRSLVGSGAPHVLGGSGGGQMRGQGVKQASSKVEPQGNLCATYESGGDSAAIGYDSKGGTSYGLYQIASNTGTMDRFMKFLDAKAPDIAQRLASAGPSNTGGKSGSMPQVWKQVAADQGKRFDDLQHEFIRESHYEPAAKSINMVCGMDVANKSQALREVLWSTAVQHGAHGATDIFVTAADNLQAKGTTPTTQNFDRSMIDEVYKLRSTQFGGQGSRVRQAVQNRLQNEKATAVAMLEKGKVA